MTDSTKETLGIILLITTFFLFGVFIGWIIESSNYEITYDSTRKTVGKLQTVEVHEQCNKTVINTTGGSFVVEGVTGGIPGTDVDLIKTFTRCDSFTKELRIGISSRYKVVDE